MVIILSDNMTTYWNNKEKAVLKTILPLKIYEEKEGKKGYSFEKHTELSMEFLDKFEALSGYKNKAKFATKYRVLEIEQGVRA